MTPAVGLAVQTRATYAWITPTVRDRSGCSKASTLKARGWQPGTTLEIPQGPVCSFHGPGDQRIAIYELSRPGVEASFVGRRDF